MTNSDALKLWKLLGFHDVTAVSQLTDVEDFIIGSQQFSCYSPVSKHTMNSNPLRWRSKRKAVFREGQYLTLVLMVSD